ncbi:MAG: hypothetical protein HY725_05275 [Candidatus Rokubacteria bacterium]|nr:hypothetical protein [Candidatus Rokubacteria bacterium]
MSPLDGLLREDVSRCLEWIAGSSPEGTLAFLTAHHPGLRGRLEEAEARLAALRAQLLDDYAAWQATLGEMENLWALAALKTAEPGAPDAFKSAA